MPLCFSYGSNMDRLAMRARCPRSRALGPARLPGYEVFIAAAGYASLRPRRAGVAHGVLWRLHPADEAALDRYEAVAAGLYAKVRVAPGHPAGPVRWLVYMARAAAPGVPRPGYLEAVLAAARAWRLPHHHRRALARLARPPRGL